MQRFETPVALAQAMARHAPLRLRRLLDPSAGDGTLLLPLLRKSRRSSLEVTAIDLDASIMKRIGERLSGSSRCKVTLHNADFLQWAEARIDLAGTFDCIVMNSPFSARRGTFHKIKTEWCSDSKTRITAIEAGFVVAALRLLRPGGRLLAIVPPSLIAADCFAWLRKLLLGTGRIHTVHELPHFSFEEVESRMYLLVFEKGGSAPKVLLQNHDLKDSANLPVQTDALESGYRLDYAFYEGRSNMDRLRKLSELRWVKLGCTAEVIRGARETPLRGAAVAIHTTNFENGFWRSKGSQRISKSGLPFAVRKDDILLKRVSRSCSSSFGIVCGGLGAECTDCVLIIRPMPGVDKVRLLFALRTLAGFPFLKSLLERGTGAAYISQKNLKSLEVPMDLYKALPSAFRRYQRALAQRSVGQLILAERAAKRQLETRMKCAP